MKLVLIYNWKVQEDDSFLKCLKKNNVEYLVLDNANDGNSRYSRWGRIVNILECVGLSFKAKIKANRCDKIVSMCATPGMFASYFNFKKNKIMIVNLLCHSDFKSGIGQKVRDMFYSHALNKRNVWVTCNSKGDMQRCVDMFKLKNRERLLHLPDGIKSNMNKADGKGQGVFSCGSSSRDWKTLSRAAERLPGVRFQVIAKSEDWKKEYSTDNISVEFEVAHDTYLQQLNDSKIVALPLQSNTTAGLLVLFDAINYGKCFIATKTETMAQFVPQKLQNMVLVEMGDDYSLAKKMDEMLNMSDTERIEIITEIKEYIYNNFSEDARNEKLLGYITKM